MEKGSDPVETLIRAIATTALLLAAIFAIVLSLPAIEDAQTGPGDADSTAGGCLCLTIAALFLGPATWLSWRWKVARGVCGLLFIIAIAILVRLTMVGF